MKDNQWPSSTFKNTNAHGKVKSLIKKIETYFEDKFSFSVSLVPSARAGLGAIFEYLNISRKDLSYVPIWSSHCIYNTVGAYSSITDSFSSSPSIALIVHKWGYTYSAPDSFTEQVIEDSSDSIHLSSNAFFPNGNSNFEIISLPKIMGVVTGGLVVSKNSDFKNFIHEKRKSNGKFSIYQSHLKWKNDFRYDIWDSLEYRNRNIETNDLNNIFLNLDKYEKNKKLILERSEILEQHFPINKFHHDKIGPLIPLDVESYLTSGKKIFMVRNFNFSPKLDAQNFRQAYLFPLHIGIDADTFSFYLKSIDKK